MPHVPVFSEAPQPHPRGIGDDTAVGSGETDTFDGGPGADIRNGEGRDPFRFAPGFGTAGITGFEAIEFLESPKDQGDPGYYTSQVSCHTIFHLDSGDVLTLNDQAPEAIINDLVFV